MPHASVRRPWPRSASPARTILIANGVLDAVRHGDIPKDKVNDLGIIYSVWLDPSVTEVDDVAEHCTVRMDELGVPRQKLRTTLLPTPFHVSLSHYLYRWTPLRLARPGAETWLVRVSLLPFGRQ